MPFHIQYCNGNEDITPNMDAEHDADCAVIWEENGDHILDMIPDGFGYWEIDTITETFGEGPEYWRDIDFANPEHMLKLIETAAERCI